MKMKKRIFIALFLLIIVFSGCDSKSERIVPSLESGVSAVFGPPGGTLTLPLTGAYLLFRENSLASTVTVSFEAKNNLPAFLPAGTGNSIGYFHEITPPGIEFGQNVTLALPTGGETGITVFTWDGDEYADMGGTISGDFIFIQLEAFRNPNNFSNGRFGAVVVKKL